MTPQLSAFRFETDRLLSPISAMEPTGEFLRYEGTYDTIAGMRREDDPDLAVGVWKADLKKADWPRVAQACLLAIETRSKDLQIAAWLLDAWIRIHGLSGLREGLHLIAELSDTYWDGLHPGIQEGDLEYRLAPKPCCRSRRRRATTCRHTRWRTGKPRAATTGADRPPTTMSPRRAFSRARR